MTEVERLALSAAFLAAVVVAGLTLSYIPHVELVTLVVFSAGVLLGSRRGAYVGALGMPLYVFANSALKGFAPSPLPILLAQAVGMAIPGPGRGGMEAALAEVGPAPAGRSLSASPRSGSCSPPCTTRWSTPRWRT